MILPKHMVFDICGVGDADIAIMVAVKDFPDMSLFQDLQDPLCRGALLVEPFALLLQHGDDLIPMLVQHASTWHIQGHCLAEVGHLRVLVDRVPVNGDSPCYLTNSLSFAPLFPYTCCLGHFQHLSFETP